MIIFHTPRGFRALQGPRTCGGPARVADGQAVGRALCAASCWSPWRPCCPPKAASSSSELVALEAPTYRWRRWHKSRSRRTRLWRVPAAAPGSLLCPAPLPPRPQRRPWVSSAGPDEAHPATPSCSAGCLAYTHCLTTTQIYVDDLCLQF